MLKSIYFKLWLVMLITLVVSLGAMLLLTQLSVKSQFLDYATRQILERLAPLEKAVLEVYIENKSLDAFKDNPEQWNKLRDITYRQYLTHIQSRDVLDITPENIRRQSSRDNSNRIEANQRVFFHHLTLHNAKKKLVAGTKRNEFNYVLHNVVYENKIIAYIGYIKPKAFLNSGDQVFVDQQFRSFAIICIAMIFTSILVAGIVSRQVVRPLTLLSRNAKKVAAGNFSAHMPVSRTDELGELCLNFNNMTATLEKNEKARKQWLADISHELRTPLAVLAAQIEAMEDGIRPTNQDNLKLLKKNTDALNLIINDLYELSLSDMGELTYDKKQTDIVDLTQEIISSYQARLEQENTYIEFFNNLPKLNRTLTIDEKRIKQLLSNIIENSFRYTNKPGKIQVRLSNTDNTIKLTVDDSEPGVAPEIIEKIFDRLYRVEQSRSRNFGGAGLGLSLCKNIVEAHNGTINAAPSPLGGLTINIELPNE